MKFDIKFENHEKFLCPLGGVFPPLTSVCDRGRVRAREDFPRSNVIISQKYGVLDCMNKYSYMCFCVWQFYLIIMSIFTYKEKMITYYAQSHINVFKIKWFSSGSIGKISCCWIRDLNSNLAYTKNQLTSWPDNKNNHHEANVIGSDAILIKKKMFYEVRRKINFIIIGRQW